MFVVARTRPDTCKGFSKQAGLIITSENCNAGCKRFTDQRPPGLGWAP